VLPAGEGGGCYLVQVGVGEEGSASSYAPEHWQPSADPAGAGPDRGRVCGSTHGRGRARTEAHQTRTEYGLTETNSRPQPRPLYGRLSGFFGWWRGTVVERRSLAGELSLSCARPAADG